MAFKDISSKPNVIETLVVGGIRTARLTRAELAEIMLRDCLTARAGELSQPRIVISSNGSVIAAYHDDAKFRSLVERADIVDADGMPLVFATRLFCKRPLIERVATTDFIHDAAAAASKAGLKFYFLGGHSGVAAKAADNLRKLHPGLQIVGCREGYFSTEDEPAICEDVRRSAADVLWLGLGSPRQEAFAVANRERLKGLGWIRTCGGLFDHYDGSSKRAPQWMQSAGMEWLYRMLKEPLRLGPRYLLTNPKAFYHLITKTHD